MNQHVQMESQWSWWVAAVSGNRQPLPTNQEPQSGYYRDGSRAVAIWRVAETGDVLHSVTSGSGWRSLDTLNDAFGRFCMQPISEDLYFAIADGAPWPDDIEPNVEAAKAGIGHNSALPHEQARDEIEAVATAYRAWLKDIGGKIETEEHDAKAENFRKRVLGLQQGFKARHKAEKEPFLVAGREVDARWITGPNSVEAQADALKKAIGTDCTPYRVERERRAREEARKAEEERQRWREEQARKLTEGGSVNAPLPPPPRKAPTGLRTTYRVEITDLSAAVADLAAFNPPIDLMRTHGAFVEAAEKLALAMLKQGVEVRGAKLHEEKRA